MSFIHVERDTLPEAWEEAVMRCWTEGAEIRTEYDRPGDPPSRDCTAFIVVRRPFREPRIHKAFPGGLEELEIYRQEVVDGIHDHWVDPESGKWSYTYHQRLFAYETQTKGVVNQFDYIIDRLARVPHTRRAQAITWRVDIDPEVDDPACLQRMWLRIFPGGQGEPDRLRLNVHMRSNDAFKAAFMNMWAFTSLQQYVAEQVAVRTGREVQPEAYCHVADSFHIYGSYFADFEGFLQSCEKRAFDDRLWRSDAKLVQMAFESARAAVEQEKQQGGPS